VPLVAARHGGKCSEARTWTKGTRQRRRVDAALVRNAARYCYGGRFAGIPTTGEIFALFSREAGQGLARLPWQNLRESGGFCAITHKQCDQPRPLLASLLHVAWNFPLGDLLRAGQRGTTRGGNALHGKTAEQTPLIAFSCRPCACRWRPPSRVATDLPGAGGRRRRPLTSDSRHQTGVAFTGFDPTRATIAPLWPNIAIRARS